MLGQICTFTGSLLCADVCYAGGLSMAVIVAPLTPSFINFVLERLPMKVSPAVSLASVSACFVSSVTVGYIRASLLACVAFDSSKFSPTDSVFSPVKIFYTFPMVARAVIRGTVGVFLVLLFFVFIICWGGLYIVFWFNFIFFSIFKGDLNYAAMDVLWDAWDRLFCSF